MRGWFDNLIGTVEDMIKKQLEEVTRLGKQVTKVMLIGGPASNDYFFQKLRGKSFGVPVDSLPKTYLSVLLYSGPFPNRTTGTKMRLISLLQRAYFLHTPRS